MTEHYEAARAFKRMQARFQAMLDASPAGGGMFDVHSNLVYVNERALKMMGQSMENVKGAGWLSCVHRADRRRVESMVVRQSEYEKPKSFICRFVRGEKETTWCRVELAPIVVEGEFEGTVASFIDVTNQRESEMLADRAIQSAEESTIAKSALISNFLSSFGGPLHELVEKANEVASRDETTEMSELVALCNDAQARFDELHILTLENFAELPLRKVAVPVRHLLDQVVAAISSKAKACALDITLHDSTPADAIVCCDLERIRQILRAVVGVAVASSQVEGLVTIDCLTATDDVIQITVTNTVRKDAVLWYESLDRLAKSSHSKLNDAVVQLVVAKRLCQAMGGGLTIESGKRTVCVHVTLPRSAPQFESKAARQVGEIL